MINNIQNGEQGLTIRNKLNEVIDKSNVSVEQFLEADVTYTLGDDPQDDFNTLNDAIDYLIKNYYPTYKQKGIIAEIEIQEGWVMKEQLLVNDINLGWIRLSYAGSNNSQNITNIEAGEIIDSPEAEVYDIEVNTFAEDVFDIQNQFVQIQAGNGDKHYFWFNVDGEGSDPNQEGTAHEVVVADTDTEEQVASALQSSIDSVSGFSATVTSTTVQVANDQDGAVEHQSSSGFTISIITQGVTQTNQVKVTSPSHGLVDGDSVIIRFHVGDLEEINYDGIWVVTETTTNTFEIDYDDPSNNNIIFTSSRAGSGSTGITRKLSTVKVERSSLTKSWEFFYYPAFGVCRGVLPLINCIFEMDETSLPSGIPVYQSYLDGLCATDSGEINVLPFGGFINAHGTNFYGTRGSRLNGNDGIFDRGGRHCVWAYSNSIINARRCTANNGGWVAESLNEDRIDSIDEMSGSGIVATRGSIINAESARANGNYSDNVHSEHGSNIVFSFGQSSGSIVGEDIGARYGGTVVLPDGGSFSDWYKIQDTQEGDLFRVNDQGIAVPVSDVEIFQRKGAYRFAPLNSYFPTKNIVAWDNADKDLPNRTPLTTLDSGQSWQSFIGDPIAYSTSGNGAFRGTGGIFDEFSSVFSWELSSAGIEWTMRRTTLGISSGVILIAKDTSNYLIFERRMSSAFTGGLSEEGGYRLVSVVDGVGTSLGSISRDSIYGGGIDDGMNATNIEWVIKWAFRGRRNASRVLIFLRQNPSVSIEVDITSLNAIYPTSADLAFIGLCGNNGSDGHTTRIVASQL